MSIATIIAIIVGLYVSGAVAFLAWVWFGRGGEMRPRCQRDWIECGCCTAAWFIVVPVIGFIAFRDSFHEGVPR